MSGKSYALILTGGSEPPVTATPQSGSAYGNALGTALAVGDFDADSIEDLVISMDEELRDLSEQDDCAFGDPCSFGLAPTVPSGSIHVLYGKDKFGLSNMREQYWNRLLEDIPGIPQQFDQFGSSLAVGDFNNDFVDDLAVGIPGRDSVVDEELIPRAGGIMILFGHPIAGLTSEGLQNIIRSVALPSTPIFGVEEYEHYGEKLSAGDFNGDGIDDLAVGIPRFHIKDTSGNTIVKDAGGIQILSGSNEGLVFPSDMILTESSFGKTPSPFEQFGGGSLVTGHFNLDNFKDLAIGNPNDDVSNPATGEIVSDAGSVTVVYGSSSGLDPSIYQFFSNDMVGAVPEELETGYRFGLDIAAGDFDGDAVDDLAMSGNYAELTGNIHLLYGSHNLLYAKYQDLLWSQNMTDILDDEEPNDAFGARLIAGDFDGDDIDDLAASLTTEQFSESMNPGNAVHILYGSETGIAAEDNQIISQDSPGIGGFSNPGDETSPPTLASGDFNSDGVEDIVFGIEQDRFTYVAQGAMSFSFGGAVNVIYGNHEEGLTSAGNQYIHRLPAGFPNEEDADKDGIINEWEIKNGIDIDGDLQTDVLLPDSDPLQKNIFVELDYMELHEPREEALDNVVETFSRSPVINPNGVDGIILHIEKDDQIPHAIAPAINLETYMTALSTKYFGEPETASEKRKVYHHGIFIHNLVDTGYTGYSFGAFERIFVVSLGLEGLACVDPVTGQSLPCNDPAAHPVGSLDQQEGTLLHELGHNLGLNHGGGDEINYKPNYLSVMNYGFTLSDIISDRPLDFSRSSLDTLIEFLLDEPDGVTSSEPTGLKTFYGPYPPAITETGIPADWNRNGAFDDLDVEANINEIRNANTGPGNETLVGYDDWDKLVYLVNVDQPGEGEGELGIGQPTDEYGVDEIIQHRVILLDSLMSSLPPFVVAVPFLGPVPITDVIDYNATKSLLESNNLEEAIENLEHLQSFIELHLIATSPAEQSTKDNILFLIDNFINSLRKQV